MLDNLSKMCKPWVGSMDLHGPEISRICSSSEISRFWCKGTRIRSKFSRICLLLRFALLTVLGPRRAAPLTCRIKRRIHNRHIILQPWAQEIVTKYRASNPFGRRLRSRAVPCGPVGAVPCGITFNKTGYRTTVRVKAFAPNTKLPCRLCNGLSYTASTEDSHCLT